MTSTRGYATGRPRFAGAPRALALGLLATAAVLAYAGLAGGLMESALPMAGALGVFAAAALSSVAGFAFSALCGPVLAQVGLEPVRLVQTLMVCSVAIQGWSVCALRREVELRALAPLLAGGLCALPAGVAVMLALPGDAHAVPLGALVLAYGLWTLLRPPLRLRRRPGWRSDVLVGASGGLTGGVAAFPGAAVAVWCGLKGWPKERQRGVTQCYILAMQVAALGVIAWLAPASGRPALPDPAVLAWLPPALLGAACGIKVFRGLSDRQFGRAVGLLLVAGGGALMV